MSRRYQPGQYVKVVDMSRGGGLHPSPHTPGERLEQGDVFPVIKQDPDGMVYYRSPGSEWNSLFGWRVEPVEDPTIEALAQLKAALLA